MVIKKYPDVVNKRIHCERCGCVFTLSRRDVKKFIFVEDDEIKTSCPCCHSDVYIDDSPELFDVFEEILKDTAEEVKKMPDGNSKENCKVLIDGIYQKILETKENMKW